MLHRRRVSAAILASLALTLALVAQTVPKLQVEAELVQVPVTVTNANNRYITDLQKEHFRVWEDRIEQKILYFSTEEAPMSLVIVLDTSESMTAQRTYADRSARDCLKTGVQEDEYALILFSSRPDPPTDFTTNISELQNKLLGIHSKGSTALYDAVYNGLVTMESATNPRKAIVVVSDGYENHSRHSAGDLRNMVREKNIQIFTYGNIGDGALRSLTQTTGGRAVSAGMTSNLAAICNGIVQELKNQYVISYKSTNTAKDGTWRKIRVDLTLPAELQLHARSKTGYLASPEN